MSDGLKRDGYLCAPDVQAFLEWAKPIVTGERRLNHAGEKAGVEFKTLAEAWRCYEWADMDYKTTTVFLGGLRARISESREQGNPKDFLKVATKVLNWGRVGGKNTERLELLGDEALPLLELNARLLNPETADLDRVKAVHPMNSGFSKIYSLMLDGFPIYDSRVACALGSLVRCFCEKTDRQSVPPSLAFRLPPNRVTKNDGATKNKRDPSRGNLKFSAIHHGGDGFHAQSNVMAAWILDELSEHGPFGELGVDERQFALQSAMFMIGHKPLK